MKNYQASLLKLYHLCYTVCLASVILFLLNGVGSFVGRPAALPLAAFFCSFLISWSEEKHLRLPVWGSLALLFIIAFFLWRKSGREPEAYYFFAAVFLVSLTVCGLCYLAGERLWLQGVILLILFGCLIAYSILNIPLAGWVVCAFLFCLLTFLVKYLEWRNRGAVNENLFFLTPVLFLSVFLMLLLPVRETPIRWETFRTFFTMAGEKLTALSANFRYWFSSGGDTYSVSFTGFNENGGLGGDILSSDAAQLSLKGNKTLSPLYITGAIHSRYTGFGWEDEDFHRPYEGDEYLLNYEELQSALSQSIYTEEELGEMTATCFFDMRYEGIKTKTYFHTPFTYSLQTAASVRLDASGDSIRFKKAQGVGYQYRILLTQLDYGSEKLERLLRQEAWKNSPALDETLQKREDFIHQSYLSLPDSLPERVRRLALEITEDAPTAYDKLKALEAYLSGYTYSTAAPTPPENQDFVDYFLFDSKTGYCTYFATAMAVLGRCAGIPTRYVEGFATDETCRISNRLIELDGEDAHAWTECYIDHIGWIPFDPTPGYYTASAAAWNRSQEAPVPQKPTGAPENAPVTEQPTQETEEPSLNSYLAENSREFLSILLDAFLLLLSLSLLAIVLLGLRRAVRKRLYAQKDDSGKMQAQMKEVLRLGRLFGYPLEEGETLTAYGSRLDGCLDTQAATFCRIRSIYQSIRFGGKVAGREDVSAIECYNRALEKQYLKSCGRMKRLLYHLR